VCGIAGILHLKSITNRDRLQVENMLALIRHRGPDSMGVYKASNNICFGSVRLAMTDSFNEINWLSNEDGSILLVFNGEIYNYKTLRTFLENHKHKFRTNSDGETIVHLYEEIGTSLLDQLDGMFAFALWDSNRQLLLLARDPFGIKPLYYQFVNDRLLFASELKAIAALKSNQLEIDLQALSSYFNYRFIAPPRTIFQNISKLEPGSLIVVEGRSIKHHTYWKPIFSKEKKSQIQFEEIWKEAVGTTAISDHQLGVFLSGGLDSGGILATLSEMQNSVPTFTIGYESDCKEDEGLFASKLADLMKSKHEYQQIKISEIAPDLGKTIWHLDEPLYSTISLSTYRLAKMASRHVKGVLTGDGSDELLLGYPYILKAYNTFIKGEDWKKTYLYQIGWMTGNWAETLLHNEVIYGEDILQENLWNNPLDAMRHFEIKYRLPEYHLARMDRLSMAHGLEARVPFLRKKVVDYLLSYPSENLIVSGKQKEILKQAFLKFLQKESLERKKQSFTAPFIHWLQGPLKEEVHDLILGSDYHQTLRLRKQGLHNMMQNCYQGDGSAFSVLWGVYMLYKWYNMWRQNEGFST